MNKFIRQKSFLVVLPAYNAERTLKQVYQQIPKNWDVILCDDCSSDETANLSKKLGIKTLIHDANLGYGANQKTLYRNALQTEADYIIMLHPDGQYDPKDLPKLAEELGRGADLVLGVRNFSKGDQTPLYKSISLRIIAFLFNAVMQTKLLEVNSGYRGFSRRLIKTVPFEKNGNGYIFDPQMLIQTKYFGFNIAQIPVAKMYNEEASSPSFSKSIEHGVENLKVLGEYILHRLNLRKASFLTS